jgi:DNA-directed RNA polymerase subunit RPC12/RpoP
MEGAKKAILIKCTNTGKPILTRLSANQRTFPNMIIESREVRCPHCGQTHVWSKKDAHLAGEKG